MANEFVGGLEMFASIDFTDFDGKIAKARRAAEANDRKIEESRKRLEEIRKRADATRQRILQLGTEARRLQVLSAKQGSSLSGFGSSGFKQMTMGAQGAIFSLGSTAIFEEILGESSPFSSALTQGLAGLATGNPLAAATGVLSGVITGLIGETQKLQQRIQEVEKRIKEERKIRRERERELRRQFEETTRLNAERLRQLAQKIADVAEDRRISTLRLLATGA